MKILVLDNYDSFTYNLARYLKLSTGEHVDVIRNDEISIEKIDEYDKIVLSPGPGIPTEAGIMPELLQHYASRKSILGVCLGMQAIGETFGAQLVNLPDVYHGRATKINITAKDEKLFQNLPGQIEGGRYHSWVINPQSLNNGLEATATDGEGTIMALRHTKYDVKGVQFHPESVLTPHGLQIIENWIVS